jgi:hypothetical protein
MKTDVGYREGRVVYCYFVLGRANHVFPRFVRSKGDLLSGSVVSGFSDLIDGKKVGVVDFDVGGF